MEKKKPHTHYDEFSEQFTAIISEHWVDILKIVNRRSPRVATLLRVATPAGLKRMNGIWRIQVTTRRIVQHEKLHQPRDNEIVAQAIRLFCYSKAQLKLPEMLVEFEL